MSLEAAHAASDSVPQPDRAGKARPMAVVALGASAGGFDPICEFLASVPFNSGMAYVVIQHLDPHRKGLLPQLLQRVTSMPVAEICSGMRLAPEHVYVMPSDKYAGFADGVLQLQEPLEQRGARLPIDHFFRALALECGAHAAGVVLSGLGHDGTLGLLAIRQNGGLTLAQSPQSAKFTPMPASAIAAEAVDLIALPGEMPSRIAENWRSEAGMGAPRAALLEHASLQQLYALLQRQTGANFANYKLNTVLRRIERRLKLHQLQTLSQYVELLSDNPAEIELLFRELLIGVTSFFRDPAVWDYLRDSALPQLLAAHPGGAAFKAWVPACSTGEEAYSLAIVFHEAVQAAGAQGRYTLQIFATDLDPDAIDRARQARFAAGVEGELAPERLARHFVPAEEGGYRIHKELRDTIIFAQQNIISDPPFTKLDLLCCRNLLIYFNAKLQEQLIPLFHYALKPGGLLMLGSADSPGQFSDLFAALPGASRIFQRLGTVSRGPAHYFTTRINAAALPPPSESRNPTMNGNLQTQVEQLLLKKHAPAAVLVNAQGDILYIHGRTGAYLEPAAGKANWNIHAMAREGLRYEVADLLKRALQGTEAVSKRGLVLKDGADPSHALDITAELMEDSLVGLVLLTFGKAQLPPEAPRSRSRNGRVIELEQQLAKARLEIQAVRDEMQASREELNSANEELQSTVEELQSTNEELTTSKEEMQSLNEELYTVNAELQSKVDDLSQSNGDMKNLLNSIDVATIFLDGELRIRRFTEQATQIYKLIPSDVNRPLGDIVSELDYAGLEQDAREVLRTLVYCERQVPIRAGGWFRVRIMPYRTVDNVIDGVVVTFINITEAKQLERQLRALQGGAAA